MKKLLIICVSFCVFSVQAKEIDQYRNMTLRELHSAPNYPELARNLEGAIYDSYGPLLASSMAAIFRASIYEGCQDPTVKKKVCNKTIGELVDIIVDEWQKQRGR